MAATSTEPHTIVQSWVSVELAQELKAQAKATGCSLSSLVRDAIADQLRQNAARARRPAGVLPSPNEAPAPKGATDEMVDQRPVRRASLDLISDIDVKAHKPITIATFEC